MNKYKGLFTFDEDNHRYVPIAQADVFTDTMVYEPDSESKEPLIKDEKIRKAVRAWAEANYIEKNGHNGRKVEFDRREHRLTWINTGIEFNGITGLEDLKDGGRYTIAELSGGEKE